MNACERFGRFAILATTVAVFGLNYGLMQSANRGEASETDAGVTFPRHVLIIRHGEKTGDETDIHLNSRGAARAAALPSLFAIPPTFPTKPAAFPTPDFLYAAKDSKKSNRSMETIMPLAAAIKEMKIQQKHKDEDFQAVVDAIFGDAKHTGKTVLVCWHHGNIPELAHAVAAKATNLAKLKPQVPVNWSGSVFDRVWTFTFDDKGNATFADHPQKLLFGDSKK